MSRYKTIVTFSSGRTVRLDGNWIDEMNKRNSINPFQFFRSEDRKQWGTMINMGLVETVKVVEDDE